MQKSKILFIGKLLLTYLMILLPLTLIGMVILPIVLLFYAKDYRIMQKNLIEQRLPRFLRIFDVGDPIDRVYGLNGDLAHQRRSLHDKILNLRWYHIFWMRYNWLALRNPLNWLQYNILGIKVKDMKRVLYYKNKTKDMEIEKYYLTGVMAQDWDHQEVGNWWYSGTRETFIEMNDGTIIREYYKVILYPEWVRVKEVRKCMRIRLGYKIGHNPMIYNRENIQWCFTIGLFNSFSGKY